MPLDSLQIDTSDRDGDTARASLTSLLPRCFGTLADWWGCREAWWTSPGCSWTPCRVAPLWQDRSCSERSSSNETKTRVYWTDREEADRRVVRKHCAVHWTVLCGDVFAGVVFHLVNLVLRIIGREEVFKENVSSLLSALFKCILNYKVPLLIVVHS